MKNAFLGTVAMAAALVATCAPAAARDGSGVEVGGKLTQTVTNKGTITAVAIGQGNTAGVMVGGIAGDVTVKGDVTQTVTNKGTITAVAIGEKNKAVVMVGGITSSKPF